MSEHEAIVIGGGQTGLTFPGCLDADIRTHRRGDAVTRDDGVFTVHTTHKEVR